MQNQFKCDLFFTVRFSEESRLSLKDYISSYVYTDKLTIKENQTFSFEKYKTTITHVFELAPQLTLDKPDEMMIFDHYRFDLLFQVALLADANKMTQARELLSILDRYCDENKLPYEDEDGKLYAAHVRSTVEVDK